MKARYTFRTFEFKKPGGTSRGVLTEKRSYFIMLEKDGKMGIGECNSLKGLSIDDRPDYELKLAEVVTHINQEHFQMDDLNDWPSIRFGLEMAMLDLNTGGRKILFENPFSMEEKGLPINGLVWMGSPEFMREQIDDLLERGFNCIKMKIGAIGFEEELALLKYIRKQYPAEEVIIRVDANGAFAPGEALEKLKILSDLDLHSIEQPIMAGQLEHMAELCAHTPLPIGLDEELIGINLPEEKSKLLLDIKPQYLIIKPSLLGGFEASGQWINIADEHGTGWWVTSALESNIGLNAISQWTAELHAKGYQGLGTGSLYTNNFLSPLEIIGEKLYYFHNKAWDFDGLF